MSLQEKSQKTAHPSGDNRFKLLDRAITKHQGRGDSLIEILHVAQGIFGYLENDLLIYVAHAIKLPISRVYGVATFYHFFNLKPNGEHTFVLCMGTACYVKGAEQIQNALEEHHHCKFGQTTKDNKVSFITARCVGSCGLAPVAVLDNAVVGKLTRDESIKRVEQMRNSVKATEQTVQEVVV